MRRTVLAVIALNLIGGARADEAQVFHLRGECRQLAKAFFEKLEEKADADCVEDTFKGSHYNAKDNRCYLQMRIRQDAIVSNYIADFKKYEWCRWPRRLIETNTECYRMFLYDVQTEEFIAGTWDGICPSPEVNDKKNTWEQHGFVAKSEKKTTFLGFELSLSSEHKQALDVIKSKMEENYKD